MLTRVVAAVGEHDEHLLLVSGTVQVVETVDDL